LAFEAGQELGTVATDTSLQYGVVRNLIARFSIGRLEPCSV